ncbi:MAG: hypothetical protein AVDCRST_MAG55-308, partial [uncultured Rubrobacteraceae bacterium]
WKRRRVRISMPPERPPACGPSASKSSTRSWWRSRDGRPTNTRPGCSKCSRSNRCLGKPSVP